MKLLKYESERAVCMMQDGDRIFPVAAGDVILREDGSVDVREHPEPAQRFMLVELPAKHVSAIERVEATPRTQHSADARQNLLRHLGLLR